uniref:SVWC domain-containing protein n=1 Tax=Glossina pallidipes TaxID=7398 RepID=A0A1B0AB43_GLOPL
MHFKLLLLTLFAWFAVAFSSIATGIYADPRYPGKCVISDNLVLAPGEERQELGTCSVIKCLKNGYVVFTGCNVQTIPAGCKFLGYKHPLATFPDCCEKKYECPTYATNME